MAGWAKRFLFDAGQLDRPIASLSGGEQARVLIARLMLQPADLLLLDEPTNDLDIPTLEVLEESLTEFPGALVLVTHDRYLLDRVSTAVLGLDGQGGAQLYADYWQWEAAPGSGAETEGSGDGVRGRRARKPAPGRAKKKLSYLEAREWEQMEAPHSGSRAGTGSDPRRDAVAGSGLRRPASSRLLRRSCRPPKPRVAALYARWAELEAKQSN